MKPVFIKMMEGQFKDGKKIGLDIHTGYTFWCEGCNSHHGVWTETENEHTNAKWSFNGNLIKPTVSPSIKVTSSWKGEKTICHSYIRNGQIEYLTDCTHELAGQTVDLIPIDEI